MSPAQAADSLTVDDTGYACLPGYTGRIVGLDCQHDQIERPAALSQVYVGTDDGTVYAFGFLDDRR